MKFNKFKRSICFILAVVMFISGILPTVNYNVVYAGGDFNTSFVELQNFFDYGKEILKNADGKIYNIRFYVKPKKGMNYTIDGGNIKFDTDGNGTYDEGEPVFSSLSGKIDFTYKVSQNEDGSNAYEINDEVSYNNIPIRLNENGEIDLVWATDSTLFQNNMDSIVDEDIDDSLAQVGGTNENYDPNVADEDEASFIERFISMLFISTSLGAYGLTQTLATDGSKLSIESLIFNQYGNTRLSFFEGTPENSLISGSKDTINDISNFFRQIALLAYMMVLVYMGVRILLGSTAEKGSKYKELIVYWVQGILIIFFFPYVIKYTIQINDAFVEYIYKYKNTPGVMAVGDLVNANPEINSARGGLQELGNLMENSRQSLKNEKAQDYMSVMYRLAEDKGWLVYAICWCVMVKQLISFLLIYFKRLLTIAFLIAIFPLVTISYAIDKIGDGKSQAFGNWYKEFALNVFVQTFHAIAYVIGMGLVLKIGDPGKNWLIILMIITFISKADDMLKAIFHVQGGGADTLKGTAASMLQIRGAMKLAHSAKNAVVSKFDSNSHIGKIGNKIGNYSNRLLDNRFSRANVTSLQNESAAARAAYGEQIAQMATPMPAADMSAPMAPMQAINLNENADALFDANATEEERANAIGQITDAYLGGASEEELNKLAAHIKEKFGDEKLSELDNLIKANMAARAVFLSGKVDVTLDEDIELLLKNMTTNSAYAAIAQRYGLTKEKLEKLRKLSKISFGEPQESSLSGGNLNRQSGLNQTATSNNKSSKNAKGKGNKSSSRRRAGDRYSGMFVPASQHIEEAKERTANPPSSPTFTQRVSKKGRQLIKNGRRKNANRSAQRSARRDIRRQENYAIKDARKLNSLKKQAARMKQAGKAGSAEYRQITKQIDSLRSQTGNISMLNQRRRQLVSGGVSLGGVGKTQKYMDKKKLTVRGQIGKGSEAQSKPDYNSTKGSTVITSKSTSGKRRIERKKNVEFLKKKGRIDEANKLERQLTSTGTTRNNLFTRPGDRGKVAKGRAGSSAVLVKFSGPPKAKKPGEKNESNTVGSIKVQGPVRQYSRGMTSTSSNRPEVIIPVNEGDTKVRVLGKVNDATRKVTPPRQKESVMADAAKQGIENFARNMGTTKTNLQGNSNENQRGLSSNIIQMASKENMREQTTTIKGHHKVQGQNTTDNSGRIERPVIMHTNNEMRLANAYVAEGFGGTREGSADSSKLMREINSLACSVAAINLLSTDRKNAVNAEGHVYTASEMLDHINNIKAVKKMVTPGSPEYVAVERILKKSEHDLADFESNLRVQVLNNPSLISDRDPNKARIINSSITYVQSLPEDDMSLTGLRYNRNNLEVGVMPTQIMTREQEIQAAQNAFEQAEARRQQQISYYENKIAKNKEGMQKDAVEIVGNIAGAAFDLTVATPINTATAFTVMGMGASSNKQNSYIVNGTTIGLGGYTMADAASSKVSNLVTKAGTKTADTAASAVNYVQERLSQRNRNISSGVTSTGSTNVNTTNTSQRQQISFAERGRSLGNNN